MIAFSTNKPPSTEHEALYRKAQVAGLLERICRGLELTEAQANRARRHYEAASQWLANSESLAASTIYPQGSIALGTTVKPMGRDEFDVDLVCLNSQTKAEVSPATLKKAIGDRLRAHPAYAPILEEKLRCWRLNYRSEFHLDITPSIPNPSCGNGGELVPDKLLRSWKESNPKGYRAWFEQRAILQPRVRLQESAFAEAKAEIESLPGYVPLKGALKRSVQLFKRHRDTVFSKQQQEELAPISVVITTLAAKSYEHCVSVNSYNSEFDIVLDVLENMPFFVQITEVDGKKYYAVPNETTTGENFAEKWNRNPLLADAFFRWVKQASVDFKKMLAVSGLDQIRGSLSLSFGEVAANRAIDEYTEAVEKSRKDGTLILAPSVGLAIGAKKGSPVKPNTFFGD